MELSEDYDRPIRVEWKLLCALRLEAPSITNTELAKRLGRNVNSITRWLADFEYQRYETWCLRKEFLEVMPRAAEIARDVHQEFQECSSEMQDRLHRIIEMTGDPKLEAELCQDWLDRAGYAPQRKLGTGGPRTVVVVTAEAANIFLRRAVEAGLAEGEAAGSMQLPPQEPADVP